MKKSNVKNIVFLKEVSSNIVDEAIIILKPNVKCDDNIVLEEKNTNSKDNSNFILNEAQMIVSNYITKLRNNDEKKLLKCKEKLKIMKYLNILLGIFLIISIVLRII